MSGLLSSSAISGEICLRGEDGKITRLLKVNREMVRLGENVVPIRPFLFC